MMEEVDAELEKLLNGEAADSSILDSKPQIHAEEFIPITKFNIGYIVCAVLLNDAGEVLMMQEAKRSCYGHWYIPAGRLEPDETLREGVIREVKEETGVEFEPTTLLCVEMQSSYWYRFTFTGRITGGTLKTPAEKDRESLQARWCSVDMLKSRDDKNFVIRAADIFPLIDIAMKYKENSVRHPDLLPAEVPHKSLLIRIVCVCVENNRLNVLVNTREKPHLPLSAIAGAYDVSPVSTLMMAVGFKSAAMWVKVDGVIGCEYFGKPAGQHDGICLSLLVTAKSRDGSLPQAGKNSSYIWHCVQNELLMEKLKDRMQEHRTVQFLNLSLE